MSEKIYAFLLRLFPSHFRHAHGEDALQLFRDRAREETGVLPRLRLWQDLLADLIISVPREYFYAQPELLNASAQEHLDGTPAFYVLGHESPRPGALFLGGLLSFAALLTFSSLLSQGGTRGLPLRHFAVPRQQAASAASLRSQRPTTQTGDRDHSFSVTGDTTSQAMSSSQQSALAAGASRADDMAPNGASSNATLSEEHHNSLTQTQPSQPAQPRGASSSTRANPPPVASVPSQSTNPDVISEHHRVIAAAADNLRRYYVDPQVGQQISDSLITHERNGDDRTAADERTFADLLARQMRDASHDMHLEMVYSPSPLPDPSSGPTPEGLARYRSAMQRSNCTFEKIEILSRNIGYLKLNSFPDPSVCESAARAAMARLNHVDAVIFDLRDNHGGEPAMVMLMAAYLFDHPEYMYSPRENTTERSWTRSPVPGNHLADKPAYILTSAATLSGAEHFTYDLKMLKRATIVGEPTGGGAHSGVFHRIDDHFGIGIPETKPINPYSQADWAVTGVAPDVKVNANDALKVAQDLARRKLEKK